MLPVAPPSFCHASLPSRMLPVAPPSPSGRPSLLTELPPLTVTALGSVIAYPPYQAASNSFSTHSCPIHQPKKTFRFKYHRPYSAILSREQKNRTFLIHLNARVVTLSLSVSPVASRGNRLLLTLGNHVLRVLCLEWGTLFPVRFIFPWKRPS